MGRGHHNDRVTVGDVAQMIGYSTSTIYDWQHAGKMPPPAPPRQIEWYRNDIKKWIAENFDFD